MRPGPVRLCLFVLAVLLASAPPTAAHDGPHAEHLSVRVQPLAPGENHTYRLAFEGGDFAAGWVFLVYGGVQSDGTPVEVTLSRLDGAILQEWSWVPGPFHLNTTRLPETAEYLLDLRNPGTENATYAFYFDQSCECLDKTVGLEGGYALFNLDIRPGRAVTVDIGVAHLDPASSAAPQAVRTEATVAVLEDERARWPWDFRIITQAGSLTDVLSVAWTSQDEDRHYIMVHVVSGAQPQRPVYLVPRVTIDAADGGAAGPGVLLGAATLVAAAAVAARLRPTP